MPLKGSPHFKPSELACKCGCGMPAPSVCGSLDRLANDALEPLRHANGDQSMSLSSVHRCPKHNKEVGGAPGSEHTEGKAADVVTDDQIALAAKATHVPAIGAVGLYPGKGIIHVDTRPRKAGGKLTMWEQVDGDYIALRPETRKRLLAAGAVNLP